METMQRSDFFFFLLGAFTSTKHMSDVKVPQGKTEIMRYSDFSSVSGTDNQTTFHIFAYWIKALI